MSEERVTTLNPGFDKALCQRTITDRRSHTWQTLSYCGIRQRGRRTSARRQEHNYYLDQVFSAACAYHYFYFNAELSRRVSNDDVAEQGCH